MASELRRNWALVVSACVGVACSSIVLPFYTIGALIKPLSEAYGWARADVTTAILFSSGLGALTAPLVGALCDRYGPRVLVLPGLAGLGIAFLIAAAMNGELWMFYLAYGAMALLGAGTTPVTWTRAIAAAFDRQRGLALGLTLSGTGLCATLIPAYTVWLVENFGWRVAYVGIALLPLLVAGPVAFLAFRPDRPVPPGSGPAVDRGSWGLTLGEAARGYRFWILCLSIMLVYLAVSGISPNLIAALTDQGFTPAQAATAQGAYGIAIMVGRVAVGHLVDRFWAPAVALVALSLPALGALVLTGSPAFAWVLAAAVLIGFAAGAELDLMSFFAARYFGIRHYARIYAVLYAILAVAGGSAPFLFSRVYDQTGSYRIGFFMAAGLFLVAAAILPALGRYPRPPAGAA